MVLAQAQVIACRRNLYAHLNGFNSALVNSCWRSTRAQTLLRLHGRLQREPAANRHSVVPTNKAGS
jgi:hypothetical protein